MFFRACSVEDFDLRRSRAAVLVGALVPDGAGVGRSAPLHPLGDGVREGSHPLALSRGGSVGGFGFRRDKRAANFSLRHFCFCGGLHENFVPDRTGARRVAFIGAFASAAICTKISFLTKQARDALRSSALLLPRRCKRRFRFRRRGRGALCSLHPLGDGVREGCDPLALSRGLFDRNFGFRENARGVPLGTEVGESHIFTSRFRRSFSFWRNAFTALFRRTGCKRCLHPAAPKNGEFMKLID